MNYSYEFTLNKNVIGYDQKIYSAKLLKLLTNENVKNTALYQFCNKFNLDSKKVKINLITISNGEVSNEIDFDFKKV